MFQLLFCFSKLNSVSFYIIASDYFESTDEQARKIRIEMLSIYSLFVCFFIFLFTFELISTRCVAYAY